MSTIVLASHLLGEGRFRSKHFKVVGLPCVDDRDYSRGWRFFWESKSCIVGIEHDHPASDELVQQLLDCPEPMCTFAYVLHHPSTGGLPHYAQRDGGTNYGEWIKTGVEWCGFSGIGFCKITPEARVRPLEESPWQEVDCRISDATDCKVHVHWQQDEQGNPIPVPHHHH